ncbi:MAG: hypothetical protein IT256_03590 [Chitinophagaceae bacterium]|nr:hypothetical protein [Chitinophagaceae bacterium]
MKKLTLLLLAAGFMATSIFISCKKDNLQTSSSKKGTQNTNRVGEPAFATFTNLETYETFLNSAPNTPISGLPSDFISMKSIIDEIEWQKENDSIAYYTNPNLADSIYESYGKLLDVLNEDKIVNLYGNLVRVDLLNDIVYTIASTTTASYDLLLQNPNHNSITQYTTNDEVARTLAGISGCNERFAANKKNPGDNNCSNNYRTKKDVTYQKAGIYFSLVAEAKNQRRIAWAWWAYSGVKPAMYMSMMWKPRCETATSWWSGEAGSWYHSPAYSGDGQKATFRPYSSSKALTSYNFGSSIHGNCGVNWVQIVD